MKPAKYILLFAFLLLLIGVLDKALVLFNGAPLLLAPGLLIYVLAGSIYAVLSFINKEHRMEAGFIVLSIPMVAGIVFSLLHWPAGSVLLILGGGTLAMCSVGFFIYSLAQNKKISLGLLYMAIGFGSLYFCFRFMRWPGATILFLPAGVCIIAAILFLLVKKEKLTVSKVVPLVVIALIVALFFTSRSELYRIKYLNTVDTATNSSENYYIYAWLLSKEGKKAEAKMNLELAIEAALNPYNLHNNAVADERPQATVERYKRAMDLLEADNWGEYEKPLNFRF